MGLVDCNSRHPNKKAKKISLYDEEFTVAKHELISASVNSLKVNSSQSASHLRTLLQVPDLAPQNIPKSKPAIQSINKISRLVTR